MSLSTIQKWKILTIRHKDVSSSSGNSTFNKLIGESRVSLCLQKIFPLVILLVLSNLSADTIELKNDSTFSGQLLKVTPDYLIVELLSEKSLKIQNITIPQSEVDRVFDETGKILYEKGEQKVASLGTYYISNLNSSKYHLSRFLKKKDPAQLDTIHSTTGQKALGYVVEVRDANLVIRKAITTEVKERQYFVVPLSKIKRINSYVIQREDIPEPQRIVRRRAAYPQWTFEVGYSIAKTHFSDISEIIQDFYALGNINLTAPAISDEQKGLNLSLALWFSQYIGFQLGGFSNFSQDGFGLKLWNAELKFALPVELIRPWIAVGYGFQHIKFEKKDINYRMEDGGILRWIKHDEKSSGIAYGVGFDVGKESGAGLFVNFYYMPFEKFKVTGEGTSEIAREIDFSLTLLSLGFRYNF